MQFTKETYERFAKMVEARQIIVVGHRINKKSFTHDFKIIGATSDGRWDFTPMVAWLVGKTYGQGIKDTTVRGQNVDAILFDAFCHALRLAGIESPLTFEDVRFNFTYFQM